MVVWKYLKSIRPTTRVATMYFQALFGGAKGFSRRQSASLGVCLRRYRTEMGSFLTVNDGPSEPGKMSENAGKIPLPEDLWCFYRLKVKIYTAFGALARWETQLSCSGRCLNTIENLWRMNFIVLESPIRNAAQNPEGPVGDSSLEISSLQLQFPVFESSEDCTPQALIVFGNNKLVDQSG